MMPGLDVAATYQKGWFGKDIVAGIVLKAGSATGEIAAHSDELHRLSGPFRPAEARRVWLRWFSRR